MQNRIQKVFFTNHDYETHLRLLAVHAAGVLEIIKYFADTWLSLDAYDRKALPKSGASKNEVIVTAQELSDALDQFAV